MSNAISIPKTEYRHLKEIAKRYETLRQVFADSFFAEPTVTSRKEVMKAFKASGRYNQAFLKSFEQGLKDSSFFS